MQNDTLLRVDDLRLTRGGQEILRGVSLTVAAGQIHCLLGRNGSGKSTLAYTLMGCAGYAPQEGHILFDGQNIAGLSIAERAKLGITLAWQEPARFEGLSVADYLTLGMREQRPKRMEAALAAVALLPAAYVSRTVDEALSGGERKRIELAAIYAMQPSLAILDEPDSGIDVVSIDDIAHLIRRMAVEGTTVLLITHRDETVPVADMASLMCEGEIVRTGDPKDVRSYYARRCLPCEVMGRHRGGRT